MAHRSLLLSIACCSAIAACTGSNTPDAETGDARADSQTDARTDAGTHDTSPPVDGSTMDVPTAMDVPATDDVPVTMDAPVEDIPRPDGCMPAIPAPVPGTQTPRPKGTTCAALGYFEYVPPNYASSAQWPLILAFHGDGERGNGTTDLPNLLNTGLTQQIQRDHWDPMHRFIVLSPQMDDRGGLQERSANSVRDFITFAMANYNVDPHRIYLTGLSGGGAPVYNYLAQEHGGIVAAVSPIAGWYSYQNQECNWRQVPIWYFHGAMDNVVSPAGHSTLSYNNLIACSPGAPVPPRYTMYANRAHDTWNLTYDLSGMNATTYPLVTTPPGTTPYDISLYDWFLQYTH